MDITNEEIARRQMLLKANEEIREAGLTARSAPQIEATSISEPGNAEARWRSRAVWVQ
jgi:hypothetical protein